MTVHHDSGQRTPERRGYSSRPVGSCGTICTSVTTDASKITCRRRACAKHAPKVEQPRRIALPLAADTLDEQCGACPSLEADWSTDASADRCTAFQKPVDSLLARTAGAMQTGAVKRARQEYMLALLASGVKRRALEAAVAADEADQRAAEAASQSLNRPLRWA